MKLYWSPASPYARKVRAVAHEKGVADRIEEIAVDAFADPQELLATNPLGKVPALVLDDGTALYDSPVICAYLDEVFAGGPLMPREGVSRWAVLRAEALADGVMDIGLGLTLERRKPETERSPTMATRWRVQLARALDAMAYELPGLPGQVTLGYIAFACALGYLDLRHPDVAWREGRPKLTAWYEAFADRPSIASTAPPAVGNR
ncbi:MAG TPA: glutathione S-transferase N-terminal domain-containing protein [Alphaproteobacteria bacterium]|nr:glutathione S-transferase N-terminal domain-containing protein [Alphaproteobacteria bacterium]